MKEHDLDKDNVISFEEFLSFAVWREAELRKIFSDIDRNNDGNLEASPPRPPGPHTHAHTRTRTHSPRLCVWRIARYARDPRRVRHARRREDSRGGGR